jgi:hypothetical protein
MAQTITRTVDLLASSYPAAATPTRLYTAPKASTTNPGRTGHTAISKLRIANNAAVATTFGIWIGNANQTRGNNGTVAYTTTSALAASQVIELIGGDVIRNGGWIDVQSASGSVSFQLFGEETIIDP